MPIWKSFRNKDPVINKPSDTATRKVNRGDLFPDGEGSGTVPVGGKQTEAGSAPLPPSDIKTKLFRPPGPKSESESNRSSSDPMSNPVTGWLVIIDGPGKGAFRPLGYGMNSVGRLDGRVVLDYGDEEISRKEHGVITYDPRGRTWFVQHGGGVNLTYLDDKAVLTPSELQPGQVITMGKTKMVFVPFCSSEFDWQDP